MLKLTNDKSISRTLMRRFNYKTIFHVLFGLFLIALPFSKGIASVAYVGLVILSMVGVWKNSAQPQLMKTIKKLLLFPALLFLILSSSLVYTQDTNEGVSALLRHSKMLVLPFIIAVNFLLIQKRYYSYLFILIRGVTIACCVTLVFFFLPESFAQKITDAISYLQPYISHEKKYAFGAYSPFIDRLQFSYLIVIALFLEWWSTYQLEGQKKTLLPINFHTITLLFTLLLLGARGAQIGFIIGLGVWLVGIFFRVAYPFLKNKYGAATSIALLTVGLLVSTVFLPIVAYTTIPPVQTRYNQLLWEIGTYQDGTIENYDYTHFTSIRRLLSWKNSWEIIQQQPLLGVGIGDYQTTMEEVYAKDKLGFPVNTQSQFLYYWVSAGLLAILAFIGLWGNWVFQNIQRKEYWLTTLSISLFAFYGVVLLLDAPLNYQVGAMTFWLLYGLLLVKEKELFRTA